MDGEYPIFLTPPNAGIQPRGPRLQKHSSGSRRRLGAISKRGDAYLRMLLTHGARSVLCHAKRPTAPPQRLSRWALTLAHRRGHNPAAVALANKPARIAWAVWTTCTPFTVQPPRPSTLTPGALPRPLLRTRA